MKGIGQLFLGLITALGTSLLVLAAASLAIIEGGFGVAFIPSPTTVPVFTATTASDVPGQTLEPTITFTVTTEPAACPYPQDWGVYAVLPGDTLESLASEVGISAEEIYNRNCLDSTYLIAGMILHLPNPAPTSTVPPALPTAAPPLPTAVLCGPYPGWVTYIVQPGDNLFRLSMAFGVNVATMKFANCLTGDNIYAGQRLYVPNVPTLTPRATNTPAASPTPLPSATLQPTKPAPTTPVPDTATPTLEIPSATPETPEPTETAEVVEPLPIDPPETP
jgi:LysM repeat protein